MDIDGQRICLTRSPFIKCSPIVYGVEHIHPTLFRKKFVGQEGDRYIMSNTFTMVRVTFSRVNFISSIQTVPRTSKCTNTTFP